MVHYSDQPQTGAEKIELPAPTIYSPRSIPSSTNGGEGKKGQKSPVAYTAFSIVAPSNRETILSSSVEVVFQVSPPLQPGHYIQVILNGRIMDRRLTGPILQLEGLDRGSYMVHATVHNAVGLMQIRSNIIQFFVRLESALDDGEPSEPPESGGSGETGVDAPQYKPGDPVDFDIGDKAVPGKDAPDFTPNGGPTPFPATPGKTHPAFQPNY